MYKRLKMRWKNKHSKRGYLRLGLLGENMNKNKNSNIKIGDVEGDVTVSQEQSGGVTTHTSNVSNNSEPEKKSRVKLIIVIIGAIASIVTVLTYFGIKPN